jgi:formylglycine-generating enzyme required for sulfatase activity/tRNA A-37 threonylcarbamoyl transferase component Bud32
MEEYNDEIYKELQSGMELGGGKYVIEKKIGEGGFGITYKAIQKGLNRIVCIKEYFLAGRCVRNTFNRTVQLQGINEEMFEKYRQAFVREAKTLATLRHPNIVEVIDVFDENNTSYMVMPFLEGRSLQSIVEKNGPLPVPDAVNFIAQITNAVGYIHERHILHRDIKPDNIMITADCKAILIDFGSARQFEQDKTQVQTAMLTHGYAPTEQYTANSRKGSYTDIYAIGATLYFVLTGHVPLEAAARMTEPMAEPKEVNPGIPDEINRTIMKAMQIKAENRHQTVGEFMDDLLNIKPSELVDETIGGKTVIVEKTKKWMWWAIGVAVLAVAGLSVWLALRPKVKVGEVVVKTEDFTGMGVYPMIWVEGGTFMMGDSVQNGEDEDCPPHSVDLDGFWIGQFEVSRGLWRKIMDNDPSECSQKPDGSSLTQEEVDALPVENVSHDEVEEFIARLNEKTGRKFALPSEAQWEYAARGGNKSKGHKFANGQDTPGGIKYKQDSPSRTISDSKPNELGIYHMSGNVAEWCRDFYADDFYLAKLSKRNPVNSMESPWFVVRGGSFDDDDESLENLTVFHRGYGETEQYDIGIRLIMVK